MWPKLFQAEAVPGPPRSRAGIRNNSRGFNRFILNVMGIIGFRSLGSLMKVVIILPTYNERGNIVALLASLQSQFERLDHDMHVLVVDDNSPDGTAGLVREAMLQYANVHLITGAKAGLGAAYIRGMQHAIGEL